MVVIYLNGFCVCFRYISDFCNFAVFTRWNENILKIVAYTIQNNSFISHNNNMGNNIKNNINNMNPNMNNNLNNNTMNNMMTNININMMNSNTNITKNTSFENSQTQININTKANTTIEPSEGYSSTQFEGSNLNLNNYDNKTYVGNSQNISQMLNQSMGRECPLCKKPGRDNFYCEQCLLNHLIPYTQNNYIEFIKNNINCLIQQKELEDINMFLSNLNIVFPNGATKYFSECYYLISDQSKNLFNEQLTNFKTSVCLGCFQFINKEKIEFLDNLFIKLPCGCIFCNTNCLNRFLNAIPLGNMKSFICGCGAKYDYIQLKYFLYFAISFNFTKLKKEIMRYMYEIIKTHCCKCKKNIEKLSKDKINMNAKELIDQEAERIFGIHKFNHLICDKCEKHNEVVKNKFYCNLCISEHSIIKKLDYNTIKNNNICSIF